ncbi:ATP-binding protein [Microbacterium sp. AG790]|uniref:ATP-binding protein n=1 Tax=Microbacterium sp. AG790 TaxID=2183995 RepID=UPI000EAE8583|nr:ATP-binding protein [Microbacterium sp. AG790]
MRLVFNRVSGTIREAVTLEDLPRFTVISGPNGSGKSNLLTAILDGSLAVDGLPVVHPGQQQQGVRLFRLAELVPFADGAQSPAAYRERYVQAFQQFDNYRLNLRQPHSGVPESAWAETLQRATTQNRWVSEAALQILIDRSGHSILDLELDDFREHHPLIDGVRDPFTISATEIFLSYHDRYNRNRFEQWRVDQGDEGLSPLTQEQFVANYGPAPWDLLDETLALIGLGYKFVPPQGIEDSLSYVARLKHLESGDLVLTDQLSSGEKTLLTVALTLFTGERLDRSIEMPKVLLLDEADASLHPMMIRSLLNVIVELFCDRYGVDVILTTHSPTTVALAPESALFVMRRVNSPRLIKATRDEALASLIVGLPTLSVSIDNRRQVFVESEDDENCYQAIYDLLRRELASPISLHFIASGRGGQGNSDAVLRLVAQLRASGNDRVSGIVDRDTRGGAPEGVYYCERRYAIENLVLDPLGVGVHLLRRGILSGQEVGDDSLRHFQVDGGIAQNVVHAVTQRVLGPGGPHEQVSYVGGFSCQVPTEWLNRRGHDLEAAIVSAFPGLNQEGRGLRRRLIESAYGDVPTCIPSDVVELLNELLLGA